MGKFKGVEKVEYSGLGSQCLQTGSARGQLWKSRLEKDGKGKGEGVR